jgi:hypothetical protein
MWPGHEQAPAFHCRIQFNSVIAGSWTESPVTGASPFGHFADAFSLAVKYGNPLPVTTTQNQGKVTPGMIMHISRVTLEEPMHKDVEREPGSVFQEHVIPFQIRFIVYPIHDHTASAQTFKQLFQHSTLSHNV